MPNKSATAKPQPPIRTVYEGAISPIWYIQIWDNGLTKLHHDPKRGLSGQYVVYRSSEGAIKFAYRWGKIHSRNIPYAIAKAAAKLYNEFVSEDDQRTSATFQQLH